MSIHISEESEGRYLDLVKVNIDLAVADVERQLSGPMGAANNQSASSIRKGLEKKQFPSKSDPYFLRVDLKSGETRYYGYNLLYLYSGGTSLPPTHPGISEGILVINQDADLTGYVGLGAEDLPDMVSRTRFRIRQGAIVKMSVEDLKGLVTKDRVIAADFVEESIKETRQDKLQPIAGTLQPDQFRLSREAADHIVAIQGPPGSGKTAVLLERLARIAFSDSNVRDKGMILIGPNKIFLDYVSEVLPTMGKSDIELSTIEGLSKWKPTLLEESEESLRVKGDSTVPILLEKAIKEQSRLLEKNLDFRVSNFRVLFTISESLDLTEEVNEVVSSYSYKRELAETKLLASLVASFMESWESINGEGARLTIDPSIEISKSKQFRAAINRIYPIVKPADILNKLKNSPTYFYELSRDIWEPEEIRLWFEYAPTKGNKISVGDVPLLDYLDVLINGKPKPWGHIAVDEAQDYSPMQWAMVANRLSGNSTASLTGDLAQATGIFYYEHWEDIIELLQTKSHSTVRELTRSYRVPSGIIEYANQFLARSEISVSGAEPFLEDAGSVIIQANLDKAATIDAIKRHINEELAVENSVCVMAPQDFLKELDIESFQSVGKAKVRFMEPGQIKGLEFDVMIIAEPQQILTELDYTPGRAARNLYVMSTRATKKLYLFGQNEEELLNPEILDLESLNVDEEQILGTDNEVSGAEESAMQEILELSFDEPVENFEQNGVSISELCKKYNLHVQSLKERFNQGNWFFLGFTQVKCINCGIKPQYIFRRHYVIENSGEEKVYHYWGIVCSKCESILDGSSYPRWLLDKIAEELDASKSIPELCREC